MSLPVNASTNMPASDNTHDTRAHIAEEHSYDPVEKIVPLIPLVIPAVGAIMIFLLAFIAVTMA
jgi:hypothetical protein